MNQSFINILIFSLLTITLFGQPISTVKHDDMLTTADASMARGDYFNALEWYRQAYREEKNSDVALSIAYSFYKLRDFENANRYYSRVLEDDVDNIFIDDRYAYGRSLRSLGMDQEAQEQFDLLISVSTDQELIELAKIELAGIDSQSSFAENEDVIIRFLEGDINSGSGEYSPIQYDENTVYFTSFDRNKEIVIDGKEKDYHVKAFKANKKEGGYDKPEVLHRNVNRDGFHVGNVAFSEDKRRMYFTRQMLEYDELTSSKIYYSDMGDERWGAAEILPSVNGEWIAKQPAIGELLGRRVLFFVSDMEGGFGGDDIYYVNVNGGNLGAPVNLGETINTSGDDITPHYFDGKLFFSTDRRPGYGGYDVFYSTWDGTNWSAPENMGAQYNGPLDDFYLNFNDGGTSGYIVSNRPDEKKKKMKSETCCYDIYSFDIKQLVIDLLVGIGDKETEDPLDGATVELADQTIYGTPLSQTLPDDYRFTFNLNPDFTYRVIATRDGYLPDTIEFNTNGIIEDQQIRKIILLEKEPPPPPQYVIDTVTINEPIRFDNIYYEFDKWDILPESEEDLTIILNLMNEYDDMVIELSSHTDSRGATPYNKDLSQKRAESARSWLLERGVAEDRIVPVGYGEEKILNRCVNGVRCPDDEHRFNRRTEFKIIAGPQSIEIKREVKKEYQGGKQNIFQKSGFSELLDTVPVITFEKSVIELGTIEQGEKKELIYDFENTGSAPLFIELATACKCTDISWPTEAVLPGERGRIVALFDSAGMEGTYNKTIDIIANTDPIVVEAKFNVHIVLAE